MAVKNGYKQTEVGEIPENWESAPLSEIFSFKQGVQTPIDRQYFTPSESRKRFIRIIDLTNPVEAHRYVLDPGKQHHISTTDLFMVRYGAPGLVGIGFEGVIANNLFRLLPKRRVEERYYYQYLNSKQDELSGLSGSTTMPAINFSTLGVFEVPLPPTKAEQEAIAEALSDADALIESLEQLIAKKRQIKQGAMQQLLTGQKRLPGFSDEWTTKPIGDLLKVRHGRSQKDVETPNGMYPILATGGQIGWSKSYLWNKPSVLIGRKGTIDRPQFMDKPFWSVDTLFYSEVLEGNSARFLFYRFCLINWRQFNEASGVPSLNAATIESIEIVCPQPAEQIAIAETLSDMDEEIAALEAKLSKARQLKQGMMQELLTGKTRLV